MPTGPTRTTQVPHAPSGPGSRSSRATEIGSLHGPLVPSGAGAMGIVHAAYDPELDPARSRSRSCARKAAPTATAAVRLYDEAQAMARLRTPTSRWSTRSAPTGPACTWRWSSSAASPSRCGSPSKSRTWQPRSWASSSQAGSRPPPRHGAGLVHRDFAQQRHDRRGRPGPRPRLRPVPDPRLLSPGRHTARSSARPAYMPPSSSAACLVGPASDQFSFCVSLYQALFGQLPFPGDSTDELRPQHHQRPGARARRATSACRRGCARRSCEDCDRTQRTGSPAWKRLLRRPRPRPHLAVAAP